VRWFALALLLSSPAWADGVYVCEHGRLSALPCDTRWVLIGNADDRSVAQRYDSEDDCWAAAEKSTIPTAICLRAIVHDQ